MTDVQVEILTVYTEFLDIEQAKTARYLALLSQRNKAMASIMENPELKALEAEVNALAPSWQEHAISIAEASRKFGVPISTLSNWAKKGEIRAESNATKNRWRVDPDSVAKRVTQLKAWRRSRDTDR
jgi:hypothetical protein